MHSRRQARPGRPRGPQERGRPGGPDGPDPRDTPPGGGWRERLLWLAFGMTAAAAVWGPVDYRCLELWLRRDEPVPAPEPVPRTGPTARHPERIVPAGAPSAAERRIWLGLGEEIGRARDTGPDRERT
jgi:hypothetical protein